MAKSFNQAIIMGNLTRDPELRTTPSGQSVVSFSVATNRVWQDANGEKNEAADFHEIVAWGKLAELASQYLTKGRKVMVSGRLQTRTWEKDGVKRNRTEIVANDINFLDRPGEGSASSAEHKEVDSPDVQELPDDAVNLDDIPF